MFLEMDNFGKFENGNKVYFNELNQYFKSKEPFKSKNVTFEGFILPQIKVKIRFFPSFLTKLEILQGHNSSYYR